MPEILLVRQEGADLSEEDKAAARKVVFGIIDGLGEHGRQQWRRLWSRLFKLRPGEMVEVKTNQKRLGWYHRKHMKMEQTIFEAQERFDNFKAFRDWLKVGAGFCDWYPGPKGGVFPVPKSISYDQVEQGAMEQFHGDAVNFLRTDHAGLTLWRHLSPTQRIDMIETLLQRFGEGGVW